MIFIAGFGIEYGFDRGEVVVEGDFQSVVAISRVTGLPHVEIKPVFIVEVLRGGLSADRVEGFEMMPIVSCSQTFRHRPDNLNVAVVLYGPIPAENPDDGGVFVSLAEELAKKESVFRSENLRSVAPAFVPLIPPGRQHRDSYSERSGFFHDEINVFEIVFIGLERVVFPEREVSIGVWLVILMLSKNYCLYDIKALFCASFEIITRLFAIQAMEEFPGGIAQIEEGGPVFIDQMAFVGANF